jgi:hypothetical protein
LGGYCLGFGSVLLVIQGTILVLTGDWLPKISSNATPSNSKAASTAKKNVAGNVPRFNLFVINASVSLRPCFFSRLASSR